MFEILFIILGTICIILVAIEIVTYIINNYIKTRYSMALFADIQLSMKNDTIYMNLINVNKHLDFWHAHESDLELFAMGMQLPAVFYRTNDVPNGYKVALTTTLTNSQVLSLNGAIKYNKFELSYDKGTTVKKVNSISDKTAKRIVNNLNKVNSHYDRKLREELIRKIKHEAGFDNDGFKLTQSRVVSHVDEKRSTQDSLRFQAIVPDGHEMFDEGFIPDKVKFFYTYYGQLYEFNVRYIGKVDSLYEWDLMNLEPGRIYPGLSYSLNGETVLPSTSLYGITKNEKGYVPDISDSILGKPAEGHIGHHMWTKEQAFGYMEKTLFKKTCDIIIKKHHEDEYPEEFLALNRVDPFYEKYEWLPVELDDFELEWN